MPLVVGTEAARARAALTHGGAREATDIGAVPRTLPELVHVKGPHASLDLVSELAAQLPAVAKTKTEELAAPDGEK